MGSFGNESWCAKVIPGPASYGSVVAATSLACMADMTDSLRDLNFVGDASLPLERARAGRSGVCGGESTFEGAIVLSVSSV